MAIFLAMQLLSLEVLQTMRCMLCTLSRIGYGLPSGCVRCKRYFALILIAIQACGVVRCISELACLIPDPWEHHVFDATTVFSSITVSGNFEQHSELEILPMVGVANGQLVPKESVNVNGYTLHSSSITEPLVTASMWGVVWGVM